jgi:hypothetical protein
MMKYKDIDGWKLRSDMEGNFIRTSRERPKTHYVITIIKNFAIDIELLKSDVDCLSEEKKEAVLTSVIKKSIQEAEANKFPWEGNFKWNVE